MNEQRLPRVSLELVETIGAAPHEMDIEGSVGTLGIENPQLAMLASGLANDSPPLLVAAVIYDLLRKQADIDWTNENIE